MLRGESHEIEAVFGSPPLILHTFYEEAELWFINGPTCATSSRHCPIIRCIFGFIIATSAMVFLLISLTVLHLVTLSMLLVATLEKVSGTFCRGDGARQCSMEINVKAIHLFLITWKKASTVSLSGNVFNGILAFLAAIKSKHSWLTKCKISKCSVRQI